MVCDHKLAVCRSVDRLGDLALLGLSDSIPLEATVGIVIAATANVVLHLRVRNAERSWFADGYVGWIPGVERAHISRSTRIPPMSWGRILFQG